MNRFFRNASGVLVAPRPETEGLLPLSAAAIRRVCGIWKNRTGRTAMINYEEELKKFHPSMDVNEAEDAIYSRDLTDVTDILKEMLKEEKEKGKR